MTFAPEFTSATVRLTCKEVRDFGMFPTIQIDGKRGFASRLLRARFEAQDLGQGPVRFEPIGMGGDGGTEALLRAGGIVLARAHRRKGCTRR